MAVRLECEAYEDIARSLRTLAARPMSAAGIDDGFLRLGRRTASKLAPLVVAALCSAQVGSRPYLAMRISISFRARASEPLRFFANETRQLPTLQRVIVSASLFFL